MTPWAHSSELNWVQVLLPLPAGSDSRPLVDTTACRWYRIRQPLWVSYNIVEVRMTLGFLVACNTENARNE